jgi:RNase P subunit RPR2
VTCERCGSIDIVRYRSNAFDKIVRLFTNRKRVICRRCGWSARIPWDHDDHYVPTMADLRVVEKSGKQSARESKFEEEFDINRFH